MKYEKCFNCEAEFKIKWPDGNEDIYGVPCFCPFCGIDLESNDAMEYEHEEDTEEE
jgi:hypothetical protein